MYSNNDYTKEWAFLQNENNNETDLEIENGLLVDGILSEEGINDHVRPIHGLPPHFMNLHPNHFLLSQVEYFYHECMHLLELLKLQELEKYLGLCRMSCQLTRE